MSATTPSPRTPKDEDAVWPLPPIGGVLGPACAWSVQPGPLSAPAAGRLVHRTLALWNVDDTTCALTVLAVEELVAGAVRHGAPPLMLELARRQGHIAVAVSDASRPPTSPEPAAYIDGHDLTLADAITDTLVVTAAPAHTGTAVVVHIADTTADEPAAPAPAGRRATAPS
ncbi:ATP-binding protein [Streptomyces sp. NPDC047085]|uniref:ATP-binding protein n=1 Tax=Streptomyces sp. NPDC047085 TaxID=3155140 RepID=UPI0033DF7746